MRKFERSDEDRRAQIVAELRAEEEALGEEHGVLVSAFEAFNARLDRYNTQLEEARGFVEDMVAALDAYMSEKSEKWQEGEKGQAYEAWKGALEAEEFEDVEAFEVPDLPDLQHADTLEALQSEVEE